MPKEPTYHPLTTAQQIMYVSQKYSFKKSVVDICTMLHFDCDINPNLMLQAIHVAMLRNQSSRVRLHKVGKEIKQYLSDRAPEPVLVMDYSDRTQEELDADLDLWSRTPFPNSSMDVQLYSIRLILEPSGYYGIYFCVSHLAFDAYALMATASDMCRIYVALRDMLPIPKAKGDYLKCCETDWEYRESKRMEKDLAYWRDEAYATEPMFTSVTGAPPKKGLRVGKTTDIINSSAYHVNYPISAELVSKVNARAKELGVSPQCFYLLAARSYLSRTNGNEEDVTINNTVARRATILQKHAGGTRVLAVPFRMNFASDTTLEDALKQMYQLQAKNYSHSDLLITVIFNLAYNKFGIMKNKGAFTSYTSMSLTYNPYSVALPEGIKAHLTTYSNGANTMPIYLSIMALDDSGALNCNYDCMESFTKPDTAQHLHTQILKALEAMSSGDSMTLGELNNL